MKIRWPRKLNGCGRYVVGGYAYWIVTQQNGPHEPPDCTCPHYHPQHCEGGHDSCCDTR